MSGNVYANGDGDYRLAEWTGFYIPFSEFHCIKGFFDYINERITYLGDMTEETAMELSGIYFNGTAGTELKFEDITEDTPCGEYRCEY
jgi:hypothetical protein